METVTTAYWATVSGDVRFESLTRRDEILLRWIRVMKEGELTVGRGTVAGERLAESAAFFEFVIDELHGMLGRWREHRAARGPGIQRASSCPDTPTAAVRPSGRPAAVGGAVRGC